VAKEPSINSLLISLKILANKLTHKEYKEVTGTMFRLYMGDKLGYRELFDPQVMADINAIWLFGKEKKVKKKAEILKLKVLEGGKDADK
jgi:hypothetical protein